MPPSEPLPAAARPGAQCLSRAQDLRAYARSDLFLHQRTFALVEWTPRLFRGDGRELLIVVPGRLALLRLLHLEQIHRVHLAPVDAHVALAHEPVLGRQFLHLRDHRLAVGMTAERLDRAQVMDHGRVDPDRAAKYSRANARLVSFWSQYQGSVKMRPWAVLSPSAWMSLMKISRPASFWPPSTMPNSDACLIELMVSPPALASPMIFAFEAFACSRNDEKSVPGNGWRTLPSTLPPLFTTTASVSRSSA